MFLKPFKVKSNAKIKSSERSVLPDTSIVFICIEVKISFFRKKFTEQVQKSFALSDDEIGRVMGKTEVHKMKLCTHSDAHLFVYTCNQQPLIIDIDGLRLPTG